MSLESIESKYLEMSDKDIDNLLLGVNLDENIDEKEFAELASKTYLVTGANSGLGFSASNFFVQKNVGKLVKQM